MKKYFSLALWILVFETVSALIGTMTRANIAGWYRLLTPPPLTPPDFVFPVMWAILYALIAATGWTLWRARKTLPEGRILLSLFALYMAFNWSWSFVFFGAHLLLTGFIWILILDALALALIVKSWPNVRRASLLMVPPTLWTLFAAYLNGGYWWLNAH